MGTRTGAQRPGSGLGARAAVVGPEEAGAEALVSGSEQDSDSGDDEESGEDGRSVKRERLDKAALLQGPRSGAPGGSGSGLVGVKPGKKTRGRVKIKMEFIDNKLRRYTTFSKRKTGIMKKQGLRLLVLVKLQHSPQRGMTSLLLADVANVNMNVNNSVVNSGALFSLINLFSQRSSTITIFPFLRRHWSQGHLDPL
uniref:MADS-box domain-containing protein n=1 Tax=Oryzias sinensis TaxID=183150 RepID=A0A8C7WVK9_9TELE